MKRASTRSLFPGCWDLPGGRVEPGETLTDWGADGPVPSTRVPTIIVSHTVPDDIPTGGVYTFVDSIEAAFERAQQVAGDKDIGVSSANVPQQLIEHGFVDEIFIHLVPVLFGSGVRLVENLVGGHVQLEIMEVIETKEVVHLRFRVIK